jgi:hypothetical protein
VLRALHQDAGEIAFVELHPPAAPGAARDELPQRRDEVGEVRPHVIVEVQIAAKQAHAAADVEANSPRRDHAVPVHVRGRDPADGEAVPPVDIGHGARRADDPRQGGHVGDLLRGAVLERLREQLLGREDPPRHAHSVPVVGRQLPREVVDSDRFTHGQCSVR